MLGIPCIRDRVVQGALKLILEPIFESDFQSGSFGYRPKRTAHEAINRVADSIVKQRVKIIDIDLKAYFDTIRHDILLSKVAQRVDDPKIMRLLKLILKTSGKRGVSQGGSISPLLSNIYLNEVDKMLEKAKEVTRTGKYVHLEYARFADDLTVMVDGFKKWQWLVKAVMTRLRQEFHKLGVEFNMEKTKVVDLSGWCFQFPWFSFSKRDDEQRKTRCSIHADNESKEVIDSKTEDHLQTFPVPANQPRYRNYQSDTAGLGQLLSSGYVEPMFWIRQGLG